MGVPFGEGIIIPHNCPSTKVRQGYAERAFNVAGKDRMPRSGRGRFRPDDPRNYLLETRSGPYA